MEEYETLIEEHKASKDAKTQFELAILERRIWNLAYPQIKKVGGTLTSKREWLAKELNAPPNMIEIRSTLLGYGMEDNPLWNQIDNENMSIYTAVRFAREAKSSSLRDGISWHDAISAILNHAKDQHASVSPEGKVFYKRHGGIPPKPTEAKKVGYPSENPRAFWAALRGLITEHFRTKLADLDQGVVERAWKEMDADLKVVLEHFQHKIDRMRRNHVVTKSAVSRRQIVDACRVLNITPPPAGKPADDTWKKLEKRLFRSLATVYHPDRSGTNDTQDMYDKVVQAHRILEEI